MRRPGPRLVAPRAVPGAAGGLSPAPLTTALLEGARPLTPVWQRWFTALREVVTGLDAGGGGGGDADTLDGLDSTDFVQKPMPLADLPAHHTTHEPGGSDALVNAAWTHLANVFTQDQTVNSDNGTLNLTSPLYSANQRKWQIVAGGDLFIQAVDEANVATSQFVRFFRNGNFTVNGNLVALNVTASANATVGGLLTVNGFGTHRFSASGAGGNVLQVRNTAAGASNFALISVGNDATASVLDFSAYSSTYTPTAYYLPNGAAVIANGAGGLSVGSFHPSGAVRFFAGGLTLRAQLTALGEFVLAPGTPGQGLTPSAPGEIYMNTHPTYGGQIQIAPVNDVGLYVNRKGSAGVNIALWNSGASVGSIATTASATTYNTTSDVRLKTDHGSATDLTALRALVVHDFAWNTDGTPDRGIFAQETQLVFPRAVTVGSDGDDLSRPWMTDYSKFVPDLIVGWQSHDARLAALESRLNGRSHAE